MKLRPFAPAVSLVTVCCTPAKDHLWCYRWKSYVGCLGYPVPDYHHVHAVAVMNQLNTTAMLQCVLQTHCMQITCCSVSHHCNHCLPLATQFSPATTRGQVAALHRAPYGEHTSAEHSKVGNCKKLSQHKLDASYATPCTRMHLAQKAAQEWHQAALHAHGSQVHAAGM